MHFVINSNDLLNKIKLTLRLIVPLYLNQLAYLELTLNHIVCNATYIVVCVKTCMFVLADILF